MRSASNAVIRLQRRNLSHISRGGAPNRRHGISSLKDFDNLRGSLNFLTVGLNLGCHMVAPFHAVGLHVAVAISAGASIMGTIETEHMFRHPLHFDLYPRRCPVRQQIFSKSSLSTSTLRDARRLSKGYSPTVAGRPQAFGWKGNT